MVIRRALLIAVTPSILVACGPGDAKLGSKTPSDAGAEDAGHTGGNTSAATSTKATGGGGASSTKTGTSSLGGTTNASAGTTSLGGTTSTGGTSSTGGETFSQAGTSNLATGGSASGTSPSVGGASSATGGLASIGGGTAGLVTGGASATGGRATGGAQPGSGATSGASGGVGGITSGTGGIGATTGGASGNGGTATGGATTVGGTAAGGSSSACVAGVACTDGIPACHQGKTACSGTTLSCQDKGAVENGTSCGTDKVCGNGTCVACKVGDTCTSPDVCGAATITCNLGAPICAVTSAALTDGTACGSNPFDSNGVGSCNAGHCQCPAGYGLDSSGHCSQCPQQTGSTFYVNAGSQVGHDEDACCGRLAAAGFGGPCRTISHALEVAPAGWLISVTGDTAGNVSPEERYPLHLGKANKLYVPNLCIPGVAGKNIINVDVDTTAVSITSGTLGTTCQGNPSGAAVGIYVGTTPSGGSANIDIGGTKINNAVHGLQVDGGKVTGTGITVTGTSDYGVLCRSDSSSNPSVISGGLSISNAAKADFFASTNCTTGPSFTLTLLLGGSGACPVPKQDTIGVYAESNASLALAGSYIRCMNEDGIALRAAAGQATTGPAVTVNGITLQHNGCAAAYAEVGSLKMQSASIVENHWGVIQRSPNSSTVATDSLVNLSGASGANAFLCNGKSEPGACCTSASCPNGGDVWNNSGLILNAISNQWSTVPVSECICPDTTLTGCTCTTAAQTTPNDGIGVLMSPYQTSGNGAVTITNPAKIANTTCP